MKVSKVIKIVIAIIIVLTIIGGVWYFIGQNNKKYKFEQISDYKYFLVKEENKFGVIDKKGNVIISPNYIEIKIPNPQKDLFICYKENNEIDILNEKSERILTQYNNVDAIKIEGIVSNLPYEKSVLKYEENGKIGLINFEGKKVTAPIYDEIQGLSNKETELLVKKDGKYGVINSKGAKIINNEYEQIVADGFYTEEKGYELSGYITTIKTQDGYRYGYITSNRKKLLEAEYTSIHRIVEIENEEDVYLQIVKNGQVGIMKNGDMLIECKYQDIEYNASNNTFILERNSQYGLANIEGKFIIPIQYSSIEFKGEYISAMLNDKTTLFDISGKEVKEDVYDTITKVDNTDYYITIDKNEKYGVILENRNIKINNEYNYLEYLHDNYFIAAKEDGELGIINSEDGIVVNFEYDVIQKIDGTNIVEAKKLNGNVSDLFSIDMQKVLSTSNLNIYINENYIQAISDEIKFFNYNGTELTNKQAMPQNKLYASKKEGKWGFVNKQNGVVVDYKYDMVTEFNEYGFAAIKSGELWGIINEEGEIVQEPAYKIATIPEIIGKYYKVYYGYGESYYTDNKEM